MSQKLFTPEEIRLLQDNLYVKKVSEKAITYTEEFKEVYISTKELTFEEEMQRLKHKIKYLEQENEFKKNWNCRQEG